MSFLFKIQIRKNDANNNLSVQLEQRTSSIEAQVRTNENGRLWVIGDLIGSLPPMDKNLRTPWLRNSKGNFIVLWHDHDGVQISGSMFQMHPVFFCIDDDVRWISDNVSWLVHESSKDPLWSKEHLLERLFFNYTLTNRTWFSHIKILEVNSYLNIQGTSLSIDKHTDIHQHFTDTPRSLKKARGDLIDTFRETMKSYYPDEPFAVSFTGGFDGRCVLASSLADHQSVTAFSFGDKNLDDVRIPNKISEKLGISYHNVELDEHYVRNHFRSQAEAMVIESNGMSTVARAHYRYAADWLKTNFNYFLSGNFGSELFRSVHLEGVMTSQIFYHWIQYGMPDSFKNFKKQFPRFSFLDTEIFNGAYLNLVENLECIKKTFPDIPVSAITYYILWEKTIRNYFSPELQMQKNHVVHRSPFLDYNFFSELQQTLYSGAYTNFREKNLIKRMKGQLFYAHFLKKTHRKLYNEKTGKGYRPSDLLSPHGLVKLSFQKILKNTSYDINKDEFGVLKGLKNNAENWMRFVPEQKVWLNNSISPDDIRTLETLVSFGIYWRSLGLK